ncbi:MAG: methionine--tRNA ligase subunit beta, partial [Aquificaceae bacterium]|nr:methionine--tRNA ligase subunit beta [Aquificaceae bacterium]
ERTLMAGIAKHYSPEELVGKKILMLANLKPRKIFGVESQGMVLALSDGENLSLIVPDRDVREGAKAS